MEMAHFDIAFMPEWRLQIPGKTTTAKHEKFTRCQFGTLMIADY